MNSSSVRTPFPSSSRASNSSRARLPTKQIMLKETGGKKGNQNFQWGKLPGSKFLQSLLGSFNSCLITPRTPTFSFSLKSSIIFFYSKLYLFRIFFKWKKTHSGSWKNLLRLILWFLFLIPALLELQRSIQSFKSHLFFYPTESSLKIIKCVNFLIN